MFFAGIVLSTLIASAAVAPFAAYHFHKSQQYAVLANLIVLPLCNVLVMPAALAALIAMPLGLEALPLWVDGLGHRGDGVGGAARRRHPGRGAARAGHAELAFVLMIAGGLWLMLWQTRWRLAGIALIAGGVALAPTLRAPDIIIGRDGELVAIRGADGELSAVGATRASFELERWLEHDGARRSLEEAAKAAAFACDGIGCRANVKGMRGRRGAASGGFCRGLPARGDCRLADRQPARMYGRPRRSSTSSPRAA